MVQKMKAVVYTKYGSPAVLQLGQVKKPTAKEDEVLIEVHAAAINYGDMAVVSGKPSLIRLMGYGLMKPKHTIPGGDVTGRVVTVGRNVEQFKPGDDAFGDIGDFGVGSCVGPGSETCQLLI